MSPRIRLITAVAGTTLALGVPAAWGAPAPDAVERSVVAREQSHRISQVAVYPDAFERAASQQPGFGRDDQYGTALRIRSEALNVQLGLGVQGIRDSHERSRPLSPDTPVSTPVTSGRDIEWPQVGIGFGVGILLALGLGMAMRLTRIRQLAH